MGNPGSIRYRIGDRVADARTQRTSRLETARSRVHRPEDGDPRDDERRPCAPNPKRRLVVDGAEARQVDDEAPSAAQAESDRGHDAFFRFSCFLKYASASFLMREPSASRLSTMSMPGVRTPSICDRLIWSMSAMMGSEPSSASGKYAATGSV